jgi:hypothetical protein
MKSYFALEPATIAEMYVRAKGGPRQLPRTARSLYDDIRTYLTGHGMQHRVNEAAEIAEHAYLIAQQVLAQEAPAPSEADVAFRANVEGGTTADDAALQYMDQLALGQQVRAMSMPEFAAARERLGLAQDLTSFLGGNDQ